MTIMNEDGWESDEMYEARRKQLSDFHSCHGYPTGPQHCWGCCKEGTCSSEEMKNCLLND